jgi:hypothetical protein
VSGFYRKIAAKIATPSLFLQGNNRTAMSSFRLVSAS